MNISRNDILFVLALICAVWFFLTGVSWTYSAALVIAYPAGITSFILWMVIRNENKKRTKFIPIILTIGFILSMTVLICLLIWEN